MLLNMTTMSQNLVRCLTLSIDRCQPHWDSKLCPNMQQYNPLLLLSLHWMCFFLSYHYIFYNDLSIISIVCLNSLSVWTSRAYIRFKFMFLHLYLWLYLVGTNKVEYYVIWCFYYNITILMSCIRITQNLIPKAPSQNMQEKGLKSCLSLFSICEALI